MTSGRPDDRFYESLAPATLEELSQAVGARLVRGEPDFPIGRVAILAFAGRDSITFATERRHLSTLADFGAGACFLPESLVALVPERTALLAVSFPQAAYAAAAKRLHRPRQHGADEPAIHPSAELEEGVEIGAGVSIGPGATIGRDTRIFPGAIIGPGVALGRDCTVGPNASVSFTLAGDRVSIYAGAVIGEAGFGATATEKGVIDIPQLGRVILQDGVTIGANSCVDRGGYDDTVIGENTKIDNLIQIGHNCVIGRNCVLASQCGISGSVTIGDGCQLGGRVGIADHINVGPGARLAANTGLIKDVPAGETWGGFPAKPVRQWLRESAWLAATSQRRGNKGMGE